jgi:hypothetical protein
MCLWKYARRMDTTTHMKFSYWNGVSNKRSHLRITTSGEPEGKLLTTWVKDSYKVREADEMHLQQESDVMDELHWLRWCNGRALRHEDDVMAELPDVSKRLWPVRSRWTITCSTARSDDKAEKESVWNEAEGLESEQSRKGDSRKSIKETIWTIFRSLEPRQVRISPYLWPRQKRVTATPSEDKSTPVAQPAIT